MAETIEVRLKSYIMVSAAVHTTIHIDPDTVEPDDIASVIPDGEMWDVRTDGQNSYREMCERMDDADFWEIDKQIADALGIDLEG